LAYSQRQSLAPCSAERYTDIIERQTIPKIGAIELQKLKPIHIRDWLSGMLNSGARGTLSARSVEHAYRVVRSALAAAVKLELVSRNVADAVDPPKVETEEVEILDADQIAAVLAGMEGSRLHPIAALAINTGMRRGELLALRWSDVDLDAGVIRVTRSLEQTRAGLRFKSPKSRRGNRSITIPSSAVLALNEHRRQQLELRMKLALGRPDADALVFCDHNGDPIPPNTFSVIWRRAIAKIPGVPRVTFHALRHTHASALIHASVDVVKVSRRLGHHSPAFTLRVYAHLFAEGDGGCADAIETALKGSK
jgi:integrase